MLKKSSLTPLCKRGGTSDAASRRGGTRRRFIIIMMQTGKLLIIFGVVAIIAGILIMFGTKFPLHGKLPGDIYIKKENFSFYFPLTTSILVSVVLSLVFWIFRSK